MKGSVLAIRLRALGDVVLTTPALRALKRGYPEAPLEVVTEQRFAPLLEGLADIDRVWPLERSARSTLELIASLKRRRYGLAVDFFGNPRSALITTLCGAAHTVGYDVRGRRFAYGTRVPRTLSPDQGRLEYAAASHVRLAVAAGGRADGLHASIALSASAREAAERILEQAGLEPRATVGMVAAGSWSTKTWPLANAALLARSLMSAGWSVLHLGGPEDERVAARLTHITPAIVTLPPCDVGVMAAVIARLGAVVGTDSGPRHVAAALGVPTFSWFGPTHPDNWSPLGEEHAFWRTSLPCRGCNRTSCPHWNCMPGLTPALAAELVLDHLGRHASPLADLGTAAGA